MADAPATPAPAAPTDTASDSATNSAPPSPSNDTANETAQAPKPAEPGQPAPEIRFDRSATSNSGPTKEFRVNDLQHTAAVEAAGGPSKTDPMRPKIAEANKALGEQHVKLDTRMNKVKVSPEHLLALKMQRHGQNYADLQSRYSLSNVNTQPHQRCPADSGLHHFTGAVAAFMKGFEHGRAKHLALEAHKHQVATDLIHHMDKQGETPEVLETLARVSKRHHQQYLKDHPREDAGKAADKGADKAPDASKTPEAAKTPDAPKAAEPGAKASEAARDAGLTAEQKVEKSQIVPSVEEAKGGPRKDIEPGPQTGSPTVKTIEDPFRQPWPYNPDLIARVAANPGAASPEELRDAFTSAKGQQLMMEGLQNDLRAASASVPADAVKGEKITVVAAKNLKLTKEDAKLMADAGRSAQSFEKEMKKRGMNPEGLKTLTQEKLVGRPISLPGVEVEYYARQMNAVKAQRDEAQRAQTRISERAKISYPTAGKKLQATNDERPKQRATTGMAHSKMAGNAAEFANARAAKPMIGQALAKTVARGK